jgi:hypothetical protein
MGDFNLDLLKFEQHEKTNELLTELLTFGLLPLIIKPTRITSHSATIIDHIYTNKLNTLYTSGIIISDVSDHFGVFTVFHNQPLNNSNKKVKIKVYKKENLIAFKAILANTNFDSVYNCSAANEAYNKFLNLYHAAYEIAFPERIITQRKNN